MRLVSEWGDNANSRRTNWAPHGHAGRTVKMNTGRGFSTTKRYDNEPLLKPNFMD